MTPDTASVAMREERARDMLRDLIGPRYSDTTLRVATDYLAQEWRFATSTAPSEPQDVGEVLEQAAKVAEDYGVEMGGKAEHARLSGQERALLSAHSYAGSNIAAAIRALKPASLASGEK